MRKKERKKEACIIWPYIPYYPMAMQYNGKRLQQQQEEDPGATTPSSAMFVDVMGAWMDGWM